jgi:hypothetical protein
MLDPRPPALAMLLALAACRAAPATLLRAPAPPPGLAPAAPNAAADPGPAQPAAAEGARLGEDQGSAQRRAELRPPVEEKIPSAWESPAPEGGRGPVGIGAADRTAIARLLCERESGGARCGRCPSYTDFAGEAFDWRVAAIHPGHFSGPGRIEALVELRGGCESGAGDSHTGGAHALVRRTAEGWKRVHEQGGAFVECTDILSHAGRSRLVCRRQSGHMGSYPEELEILDFDEKDGEIEERGATFLTIVHVLPLPEEKPAADVRIVEHALRGVARYQAGDERALVFEATVRVRDRPAPAWDARLRYRLSGGDFTLEPESRAAYERLEPFTRE